MVLVELPDIVDSVRGALPEALVATDFDGTLAPLVDDPQTSRPIAGAIEALAALSERGTSVAVVTGRDAATAVRLGGLADVRGLVVAGLYGLETWQDGELDSPDTPEALVQLQHRLPALLEHADPRVWIEDKRLSLVLHGRKADDPDAALAPLRAPVQALAGELGLEVHPGRDVLELRLPGYDKAGAVRRLADGHAAVLYFGDDLGDVCAFAELQQMRGAGRIAYGIAVRSSGVTEAVDAADATVADPAAVVDVLKSLAR